MTLVFSFLILLPSLARAAACCGGGFALPSLITGDDRAQVTTSLSQTSTAIDVAAGGHWTTRANPEAAQTIRLEGASLVSDRWQIGGGLPLLRRARTGPVGDGSATGVGDLSLGAAFEALPEWDYNPWKPKGLAFLQLVLPTGRSRLESRDPLNLDITGRGLVTVGPGLALLKTYGAVDAQVTAEVHRSLPREVESPALGGRVALDAGTGGTVSLNGGYSRGDFRFGLGALLFYEDSIQLSGATATPIDLERYVVATASLAYLASTEWALSATYSDQTLFGAPTNTTLSRALVVSLQRRWAR